jgi:hypothetical protein
MKLTGYPRELTREDYARAIDDVLCRLRAEPDVLAVYQVGGVRTPGISDVDLLVIFRDDSHYHMDPLAHLSADGRYVFDHGQFGMPARHFAGAVRFAFFHDYRLLYGQEQQPAVPALEGAERDIVNRQTALEYLLKMYVSMSVERCYGIIRVRNLLLLGRALRYDLEYVGIADGHVARLVDEVTRWREIWFSSRPGDADISRWFTDMYAELESLLLELLARTPLFVPEWADRRIASNMELRQAARLGVEHYGVTLPSILAGLGRRYFNLQHRFNRFTFHVPLTADASPVLRERHELIAGMGAYNRARLPHFMPSPSALGIFRRRAVA